MTPEQFLQQVYDAAQASGHIWPLYAACEAALESGWGTSRVALDDKNLFGMKQHRHAIFGTAVLPTAEVENGEWVQTTAGFVRYPDWASCFADRMATLRRLAPEQGFEHYALALDAPNGQEYVIQVSMKWSTDSRRAQKVLLIYQKHAPQISSQSPVASSQKPPAQASAVGPPATDLDSWAGG